MALLESPFREAQQTDRAYILALGPGRLLTPFRLATSSKPERYGN